MSVKYKFCTLAKAHIIIIEAIYNAKLISYIASALYYSWRENLWDWRSERVYWNCRGSVSSVCLSVVWWQSPDWACGSEFSRVMRSFVCAERGVWIQTLLFSLVSVQCQGWNIHAPYFVSCCECTGWVFIHRSCALVSCVFICFYVFTGQVFCHVLCSTWLCVRVMICLTTCLCFVCFYVPFALLSIS